MLATVGLAGYAFAQRQAANTARDDADSRELAVEAAQLHGQDVSVAAQLSLAAYQTAATPAALASVLESSATPVAARLIDSTDVVEAAALSPDDRLLAAAGDGGTVRLWDVSNPRHPLLLALLTGPADTVYALASAPMAPPWPPAPVLLGRPLTAPADIVTSVAFSPDGATLAAGSYDHKFWLWNVSRPAAPVRSARPLTGATDSVNSVGFSPGGTVLAAASSDDTIRLWDVATGRLIAALPHPGVVTSVAWAGGHLLVSGGAEGTVRLWQLRQPCGTRTPVRTASAARTPNR